MNSNVAEIKFFELYLCQETKNVPIASMWKKMGDIETLTFPMMCKIRSLFKGFKYYFALRAMNIYDRRAPFFVVLTYI